MSEHDYERSADAAERELADMEERSEALGDDIDVARDDWEEKVADSGVPGAVGDGTTDDAQGESEGGEEARGAPDAPDEADQSRTP
jgi:hypothetical protein